MASLLPTSSRKESTDGQGAVVKVVLHIVVSWHKQRDCTDMKGNSNGAVPLCLKSWQMQLDYDSLYHKL